MNALLKLFGYKSVRKCYAVYSGSIYTGGGIVSDIYLNKQKARGIALEIVALENQHKKEANDTGEHYFELFRQKTEDAWTNGNDEILVLEFDLIA